MNVKREKRPTRKQKEAVVGTLLNKKPIKDTLGIARFTLTENQKVFANKIIANDMVICSAPAGTGKSFTALHTFVNLYLQDPTKQIIVVRTPVESGADKVGFLPNSLSEKIEPHFSSIKVLLEKLLSKGKVETDLDHRIHFKIPNYMLGSTFDNALYLLDETQELQPKILKLLLERVGENSKVVILGDPSQRYSEDKDRNGLNDVISKFFNTKDGEITKKFPNVEYHSFEIEDVMRGEFCKTVLKAYNN